MLLKVGELAKRTGLTVRTLHHYDDIGLLTPSSRSAAGYRLYNKTDVARLHSIQALRSLGLPLTDIGNMLAADGASLPMIIGRQVHALEREISRATELRNRLILLQDRLFEGDQPEMSDWLATLELMTTYSKYFSAMELKLITESWQQMEAEWQQLIKDVHVAMTNGMAPAATDAQVLARRWMDASMRWMKGDLGLLKRWGEMRRKEPVTHGSSGISQDLFNYIQSAVELRLAAFRKYLGDDELKRLCPVAESEWANLEQAALQLMQRGVPPESDAARALAARWSDLMDHIADRDPGIREKLLAAIRNEPLLQAAAPVSRPVRDFLRGAFAARHA